MKHGVEACVVGADLREGIEPLAVSMRDEAFALTLQVNLVAAFSLSRAALRVLIAANHRSFLDHYLLNAASPRVLWFVGKAELDRGLAGCFHKLMGMIPVERGTADLQALELVADVLRAGEAVALFPEGTRSVTGELFRFRSGLARLAASARVPVVPVGLIGTAEVWPRGQRPSWPRPRPGLLQVHFGQAISPPGPLPRDRRQLTACVYEQVAQLCGQPKADGFAPVWKP